MDIFSSIFSNIWSIFLIVLFFGGSIFVHELGHFLAARRRGLKVERFSIGMGPKIYSWHKDGVEYCISLLPIGGYVALPQLAEMPVIEGKSKEKKLPPISYSDKMIVSVMGAVFNLIFAFFLATILWVIGQPASMESETTTIGYVAEEIQLDINKTIPSPAFQAGLLPGDKILAIDGSEIDTFKDVLQTVVTGVGRTEEDKPEAIVKIERNGKIKEITVYPALMQVNVASDDRIRVLGISPKQSLEVRALIEGSPAAASGLKQKDEIVAVNGQKVYSVQMINDIVRKSNGSNVDLTVKRKNDLINLTIEPQFVAYTKPLAKLQLSSDENHALEFLPIYPKTQKTQLTDPNTASSLMFFDPENTNLLQKYNLTPGDSLLSVNNQPVTSVKAFTDIINSTSNKSLNLELKNDSIYSIDLGGEWTASIVEPKTRALLGIQFEQTGILLHTNPVSQFINNIGLTFRTLRSLVHTDSDLKLSNLMGPPGIVRVLHTFTTQDLRLVLWFVIFININLAILNLLPIPVLDGGHMLYATIAKLSGRPLPINFVAATQALFMVLLFSLMIYVSFFDVRRWQGDNDLEERILRQQQLYIPTEFAKK